MPRAGGSTRVDVGRDERRVRRTCGAVESVGSEVSGSLERAQRLVSRYVDHVRTFAPVEATRMGIRDRDGDLPDLSPETLAARSRDLSVLSAEVAGALAALDPGARGEDREARGDLELLADECAYRRFILDVRPRFLLDPLAALETASAGIHELLQRDDPDPEERCRSIEAAAQRARRMPVLLEQAGSLLESAPAPHLAVALERVAGLIPLVRDELPRRAAGMGVDVSPARDAGEVAAEALDAYAALLTELGDEPPGDWRLGPDDHRVILSSALGTRMPASDIHARARAWRDEVREELADLAASTWPRRFGGEPLPQDRTDLVRRTLESIADTAVDPDRLVDEARHAVDRARAFTLDAGIVDVPPAERLRIAEVPAHLRGIAVAFVAPPPPFAAEAGCTYYLSPVRDDWDHDQVRAHLREYNPTQLRSLAIHEAYPGHFVQLEHAAQHPRLARRLLTRPVFAEGWAVYAERIAVALGFGTEVPGDVDPDDLRIIQRKGELRIATIAMLDVGLHAGDLDDPAAIDLLTGGAFLSRAQARNMLDRARVSGGQMCSYFVGGEEMADLRRDVERAQGEAFDLRDFHQRVLSHGTPSFPVIAAALADDQHVRRPFALSA